MMRSRDLVAAEEGQMLLATGIILMMSLLTMSLSTIQTASLGEPYDPAEDAVLDTVASVVASWESLLENRSSELIDSGMSETDAVDTAAASVVEDLMRHGEHRGVEIILVDVTHTEDSGVHTVSASAGIADSHARLEIDLSATLEFS